MNDDAAVAAVARRRAQTTTRTRALGSLTEQNPAAERENPATAADIERQAQTAAQAGPTN